MPFASSLSEHPLATHATGEVVGQILEQLGPQPDVALLFVTGPFAGAMDDIAGAVRATLQPGALVGATAVSVLGGDHEVEESAAISLFAGRFPASATRPTTVRLTAEREGDGWRIRGTGDLQGDGATLVLLADPFTFPVDALLDELGSTSPGLQIVGGLASAAGGPGGNRLVADDLVASDGAVGLLLPPGIGAQAVVSQGCRPLGDPLVVTKSERHMIYEIAGRPALDRLLSLAEALSAEDRALLAQGPHMGVVVDERKATFERGDFLVRNITGADREVRAIAVGGEVEVGTTVQFHVRDADTADEDLRSLLAGSGGDAALVFTCNGRGTRLFGQPDHDAGLVSAHLDGGPVAGMFCAGEIGPVGGRPFLHGFTASILLLEG
ncbi:MAG: hypothetical protein JWN46_3672 [Acidimicrobiales bacterium]|nr:hypothetical protein [Acidimicrobiales bacterium]